MTWIPLDSQVMVMAQRPLRWPVAIGKGLTSAVKGSLESKRCGNCGILANTLHSTAAAKEGGAVKEKGDNNSKNGTKEKNGVGGTLQCSTCHAFWARTGQVKWSNYNTEIGKSTKMQFNYISCRQMLVKINAT